MRIDLRGEQVIDVLPHYQARILLTHDIVVAIESDFTFEAADTVRQSSPRSIDRAIRTELIGTDVIEAQIDEGALTLRLSGDRRIVVPPDDQYESWNLMMPGRVPWLVVSTPGGNLAIWS